MFAEMIQIGDDRYIWQLTMAGQAGHPCLQSTKVASRKEIIAEMKSILPMFSKSVPSRYIEGDVENRQNTKPCRIDKKTPCVQYPDDDCDCDPCEDCEVAFTHTDWLEKEVKRLKEELGKEEVEREIEKTVDDMAIEGCREMVPKLQDKIIQLEKQIRQFGKDLVFHICMGGVIRPYSTMLCSCCVANHESNFNVLERIRQLDEFIDEIDNREGFIEWCNCNKRE